MKIMDGRFNISRELGTYGVDKTSPMEAVAVSVVPPRQDRMTDGFVWEIDPALGRATLRPDQSDEVDPRAQLEEEDKIFAELYDDEDPTHIEVIDLVAEENMISVSGLYQILEPGFHLESL